MMTAMLRATAVFLFCRNTEYRILEYYKNVVKLRKNDYILIVVEVEIGGREN